jgi:NADH-quinone oxidoreductase subunit C
MERLNNLKELISTTLGEMATEITIAHREVTVEVPKADITKACRKLRDTEALEFDMVIDVCGVDYLHYGIAEWETHSASGTGFDRGVESASEKERVIEWNKPRFAVVYHLLSTVNNQRVRVKAFLTEEDLMIDTVVDVWPGANWFERETFDMFGILFNGHPDMRRILSDYGFIGNAFRKDFPLSGNVEVRYDAKLARVVYEPVKLEKRILVPKVIREANRFEEPLNPPAPEPAEEGK